MSDKRGPRPPCGFPGCKNEMHARGMCSTHDLHMRKTGEARPIGVRVKGRKCGFEGCENAYHGHGLCSTHRDQLKRGGSLRPIQPQRPRASRRAERLPADAVRSYAQEHGFPLPFHAHRQDLTIHEADRVCIRHFGVHPCVVFGEAWWSNPLGSASWR